MVFWQGAGKKYKDCPSFALIPLSLFKHNITQTVCKFVRISAYESREKSDSERSKMPEHSTKQWQIRRGRWETLVDETKRVYVGVETLHPSRHPAVCTMERGAQSVCLWHTGGLRCVNLAGAHK